MLDGVNNRPEHARMLAEITRRMRSNVNLIPFNPVEGLPFRRPTPRAIETFTQDLRQRRVNVHVRTSRGLDQE